MARLPQRAPALVVPVQVGIPSGAGEKLRANLKPRNTRAQRTKIGSSVQSRGRFSFQAEGWGTYTSMLLLTMSL